MTQGILLGSLARSHWRVIKWVPRVAPCVMGRHFLTPDLVLTQGWPLLPSPGARLPLCGSGRQVLSVSFIDSFLSFVHSLP